MSSQPVTPKATSIFDATPLVQKYLVPNKDDSWAKTVLKIAAFILGILPLLIIDGIKAVITYLKSNSSDDIDNKNPAKLFILKRAWHKIVEHKGKVATFATIAIASTTAYYFKASLPEMPNMPKLPTEGRLSWINPWTYTMPEFVTNLTGWAQENATNNRAVN